MIKINKPSNIPQILVNNSSIWTTSLLDAINKYGSYSKIPDKEKDKLLFHYRHKDIKEALFESSHKKCAFCEGKPSENGNMEVEHFYPKSIYPNKAFSWDNFLPVCRKCNLSKGAYDTGKKAIVNPYNENPELYFSYNLLQIIVSDTSPNKDVSKNTIEAISNLNSHDIMKARSEIYFHLCEYVKEISNYMEDIKDESSDRKKKKKMQNLIESIEKIELLTKSTEKYSGFCKFFLTTNDIYITAKDLIDDFENESAYL